MIILQNISKVFNKGKKNEKIALDNINLEIKDGELLAIMGKSGAGKSTLLNIIGCLDAPTSGTYKLGERTIDSLSAKEMSQIRNEMFGVVTQTPFLIDNLSPLENVMIPLMYNKKQKKDRVGKVINALNSVEIDYNYKGKTVDMSGGEQQRISIARAIVNNPNIILADEPTGSLDTENGQNVMNILKKLNAEGKTIIIITHDIDIATQCSRIITIKDGAIV